MAEAVLVLDQMRTCSMVHLAKEPPPGMVAHAERALERRVRRECAGRFVQRLAWALARRHMRVSTRAKYDRAYGRVFVTEVTVVYPRMCRAPRTRALVPMPTGEVV